MSKSFEEQRKLMSERAISAKTRTAVFSPDSPIDWRPDQIPHPWLPGWYLNDDSAWEIISRVLATDHEFNEIDLRKPPGKKAYECLVDLDGISSFVYIKVEMGANKVIGRSFHYSDFGREVINPNLKVYKLEK